MDAELMRITRLRSAHAEEQYRIRTNLRRAHDDVEAFTARLDNLRQDIAAGPDTTGDNFQIELGGQILKNRGIAGELLIRQREKMRKGKCNEIQVGRFAGFELSLRSTFSGDTELLLHGKNTYAARITDSALGTICSLESTVGGLEDRATKVAAEITDAQQRATGLEPKVGTPFDKEERHAQLSRRQSEIIEQLDLAKNQAPGHLPDEPVPKNAQSIKQTHDTYKTATGSGVRV